jgi:small subunit ribosomal protein S21
LKKRQHFEKPSIQKKKKEAAAKKRLLKKIRKMQVM